MSARLVLGGAFLLDVKLGCLAARRLPLARSFDSAAPTAATGNMKKGRKDEAGGGGESAIKGKAPRRNKRRRLPSLCLKSCLSVSVRPALVVRGSVVRLPRRG
jgi:hypothetical protein